MIPAGSSVEKPLQKLNVQEARQKIVRHLRMMRSLQAKRKKRSLISPPMLVFLPLHWEFEHWRSARWRHSLPLALTDQSIKSLASWLYLSEQPQLPTTRVNPHVPCLVSTQCFQHQKSIFLMLGILMHLFIFLFFYCCCCCFYWMLFRNLTTFYHSMCIHFSELL